MYGNIYDHHGVVYEFENGAKLFSNTRQIQNCWRNMSASAVGTKGHANIDESRHGLYIVSDKKREYEGERNKFYQTEHDELFASIRNFLTNGIIIRSSCFKCRCKFTL